MSPTSPLVRLIVARPRERLTESDALAGTVRVLERLGRDLDIAVVHDAETCLARAAGAATDLVVLDQALGDAAITILDALRANGPPVVVVTDTADDQRIRDVFLHGAADCVAATADYGRVLPVVALEQIRRWRETSARRGVERRLHDLERFSETVVQGMPAPLVLLDGEGRVVHANAEFVRAFDLPLARARGVALHRCLPLDLGGDATFRALLHAAAHAGSEPGATGSAVIGSARRFDVRVSRLDSEGMVLVVLWDVTERERLARQVEDLQRYNENIIQNMNSALLVIDRSGTIAFANQMAERIFGAEPGALRGAALADFFPGTPPEKLLVARTLAEGVRFRGAETVLTRRDGEIVPIGVSCAPLGDASDLRSGAVVIFQDLSEIKELQRHVLQTEKMASIGQLAAGVAHEINNPMGFIHANLCQMTEYLADLRRVFESLDSLREAVAGDGLAGIRERAEALEALMRELDVPWLINDFGKALRESQEGSERIRHIVQDLRGFSRQDAGERTLADVNECLDSTASIAWGMMKHSVVLRKEYRAVPKVRCYPLQLQQVFMNLLVNAYHAIQERFGGAGELGEIRLQTIERDGGVAVVVTDNGVGIRPENLNRIFDPFFTTKEVGIGTGLGLSTSFGIVQRHGGSLRVESKPGEGSVFEVFLPLAVADLSPLGPES